MNRNYWNKRERVGIRRFCGKEGHKWYLLIMVGENGNNGNKREIWQLVGMHWNVKENTGFYGKMWELIIL